MRILLFVFSLLLVAGVGFSGCGRSKVDNSDKAKNAKVVFLHHSTGGVIWRVENSLWARVKRKIGFETGIPRWFDKYNKQNGTNYQIREMNFPKRDPYGWNNYPYDYYNIWVKNGHQDYFMEEPTLKTLTADYDVVIFKHCFPASDIVFDIQPDVNSDVKSVENYKLQYEALKKEMYKYPDTKFLLWTPPALVEAATTPESARAATEFSLWVIEEWDQPDDNIFIWDFRTLETEGGIYLAPENAAGERDSHPSYSFAKRIYPLFARRIVEVIEHAPRNVE
jgi:hypothetical protein